MLKQALRPPLPVVENLPRFNAMSLRHAERIFRTIEPQGLAFDMAVREGFEPSVAVKATHL
jgi:hypothetical protein